MKRKCPVCQSPKSVLTDGYKAHQEWYQLIGVYVHKRMDGRVGCGLCGASWKERRRVWWPIRLTLSSRSTRGKLEIGGCEESHNDLRGRRIGYGIGYYRLRLLFGRGW